MTLAWLYFVLRYHEVCVYIYIYVCVYLSISISISICIFVVAVVQLLSLIQVFVTPRTVACQAPLCFNISWSFLKFMSIELVRLPDHLILCYPTSLPPVISSIRVSLSQWVDFGKEIMCVYVCVCVLCSVVSNSLLPHGL